MPQADATTTTSPRRALLAGAPLAFLGGFGLTAALPAEQADMDLIRLMADYDALEAREGALLRSARTLVAEAAIEPEIAALHTEQVAVLDRAFAMPVRSIDGVNAIVDSYVRMLGAECEGVLDEMAEAGLDRRFIVAILRGLIGLRAT